MASRGRFKGWRSEATVARMSPEDQKRYRDFVKEVENARRNGLELPEPPIIDVPSTSAKENPVRRRRAVKSSQNEINSDGFADSAEEDEDDEPLETKNWWDENPGMSDYPETVIHHCAHEGFCIIETNERYWVNKIKALHEKYPDLVLYQEKYCDKDTIRVKIPYKYMKRINISVRTISDEQRERMSQLGKSRRGLKKEEVTEDTIEDTTEDEETVDESAEERLEESTYKKQMDGESKEENDMPAWKSDESSPLDGTDGQIDDDRKDIEILPRQEETSSYNGASEQKKERIKQDESQKEGGSMIVPDSNYPNQRDIIMVDGEELEEMDMEEGYDGKPRYKDIESRKQE